MPPIKLCTTNLSDGETVHQRCLLLTGTCVAPRNEEDSITITTTGANGVETFPEQSWPVADGSFKVLVMLSPGVNTLRIHHEEVDIPHQVNVTYIPLLQCPPLHLAIMVAKDSPLLIDCPPHKRGGFSAAHFDLDAAIAKFRMTAYMWQAMTAEDLRSKGLGRRTFRLDEEWAADTLSRDFLNAIHDGSLEAEGAMRSTAKIHIIQSSRTTKEIRDADVAQQNQSARRKNSLFNYFEEALKEAGGLFTSSAHPIVAGLILDSHYSISQNLILGHAALGCHNPNGISLGIFGSHLTYSWPRFLEEVVSCLSDTRSPGDKVGNDSGECGTMWEACTIGQGAHLHEVGHAFGSPHRPGIMERGYAQDWPQNFLAKTAYCTRFKSEGYLVTEDTPNNARWNLSDALSFRALPHFQHPSDPVMSAEERDAVPQATVNYEGDEELRATLRLSCPAGLVRIAFDGGNAENHPSVAQPTNELLFTEEELEQRHDRSKPLSLFALGFNGKELRLDNVWKRLAFKAFVRIPGTNIRLFKRSVYADGLETRGDGPYYEWAQLLKERGPDGNIHRATSIDLRVGMLWDGGVVKYQDGHKSHWGPMKIGGHVHRFGGHASEEIELRDANIKRIEVNRGGQNAYCMRGIRMHLTDRRSKGEVQRHNGADIIRLEPASDEVIVGFFGKSDTSGFSGVVEFGIITAPKAVGLDGLPDVTFDLPELRNTAGLEEGSQGSQERQEGSDEEDSDQDMSDGDGSDQE